jgi:hypothetical protein
MAEIVSKDSIYRSLWVFSAIATMTRCKMQSFSNLGALSALSLTAEREVAMPRPVALTLWSLAAACLFAFSVAATIMVHQDLVNSSPGFG